MRGHDDLLPHFNWIEEWEGKVLLIFALEGVRYCQEIGFSDDHSASLIFALAPAPAFTCTKPSIDDMFWVHHNKVG